MGHKQTQPFHLCFNVSLKAVSTERVTSDGGMILAAGLDERLGIGELIEQHLYGPGEYEEPLTIPHFTRGV